MPLHASLYLDRIDLASHLGPEACSVCRVGSQEEFLARLRAGRVCAGQCPHWPRERIEAFRIALDAGRILPVIPSLDVPRPAPPGLAGLNGPSAHSPVLVTGNSQLTHEVLLAVLSTTGAPMWMAATDTDGHTVDMAMVYGTLTPDAAAAVLRGAAAPAGGFTGRIVLPGLAGGIAAAVADRLGRPVEVGPVCAAELPLYFGAAWARGG